MIKEDNQSELWASLGGYFSQEIATISRRLSQDSLVQNGPFKDSLKETDQVEAGDSSLRTAWENKMPIPGNVLRLFTLQGSFFKKMGLIMQNSMSAWSCRGKERRHLFFTF